MRRRVLAPEREIRMTQRAGISTVWAELLLLRMQARVEELYREREALQKATTERSRG